MTDSSSRAFEALSADQIALVNGVCDRFETAWRDGTTPSISSFLAFTPQSVHQVLLRELVLIDANYRTKAGETLDAEIYQHLLPEINSRWLSENLVKASWLALASESFAPPRLARYEVVGEAGRGGMGVVYQARDRRLGRLVCLKSLHPQAWGRPERLARLRREAQALSSLNHPNICTIYELEEHKGIPVLVFEWVDGKTFRDVAMEGDCLSRLKVLFLQAAKALAAAHGAGIVHRDIKPENLMVRSDGLVKVLDFGLARRDDGAPLSLDANDGATIEGTLLGTARYMSPEQALGRQATPASDVFSLGIVLYELATGQRPFSGGHLAAVLNAIVEVDPEPAASVNSMLDQRIAALVAQMLDKRPEARPTSVEIVKLLENLHVVNEEGEASHAAGRPATNGGLVGREVELRELRQAFAEAKRSRGKAVFVCGEPGIGKSTLLEAFVEAQRRQHDALIIHGRCPSRLSVSDAYLPVLDALARAMDGFGGDEVRRALEAEAPAWRALTSSSTDALGQVLAESGPLSSARLKREFRSLIKALSKQRVVLLLLDDLHWADDSTIDLLSYIGQELNQTRLLLLGAYRPADPALIDHPFEHLRREFVARGWGSDLALPFLSRDDINQLLSRQFPTHRFPESFAAFLHQRTEGSPLFLHGLVRYLSDRGAISQDGDGWVVADELSAFDLKTPNSIAGVINAALAGIADEDRRLLQAASILGGRFDAAVVADMLQYDRAAVEDQLQLVCRQHGLIGAGEERELPDGTLTHRHRFIHVFFQEAFYRGQTPARRAASSLQAAQVLTDIYARRADEITLDLAFLYEAGRNFSRAVECLQQAAGRDIRIGASREAAAVCHRGIEVLAKIPPSPERDQQELALQFTCGFAESLARGYGSRESLVAYERAETLCLRQPVAAERFSVLHGLWAYHLGRMDAEKIIALGNRLVEFAVELESGPHRFAAHTSVALVRLQQGDMHQAQKCLDAAKAAGAYAVEDDQRFIRQMCMPFGPLFHCTRSWLCQLQGRNDEALAEAERAAEWGDALGTPQFQVHSWYAMLYYMRGDAAQALAWAGRMLAFARRTDFESYLRTGTVIEAWAAVQLGEIGGRDAAERLDDASVMVAAQRQSGIRTSAPGLITMIGEAQARLGRKDKAEAAFADAIAFGRESGERWWEAETLRQMGLLQERTFGDLSAAADRFDEGLALAQAQGALELERRCQADLERLRSRRDSR